MSDSNNQDDRMIDEELVAYLDGELDAEAEMRIDARLAEDPELRQRLSQHRRAWELLDELPRTEASEHFSRTTVEMVAVGAADRVEGASRRDSFRTKVAWVIGGGVAASAAFAGYALVASIVAAPDRQLVEDLRVIENLDEYRAIEDIEFLKALERDGLFGVEAVDGA